MDPVLAKLVFWEKIFVRLLILMALLGAGYGSYNYGYNKGMGDAFEYIMSKLSESAPEPHSPMEQGKTL